MKSFAKKLALVSAVCVTCCCSVLYAQDTIQSKTLKNVTVTSKAVSKETSSTTPVQVLDRVKLERINAVQLSDAVKQMSGVVLKDYGGVGGIKTVSARGLGSQFSTLAIDGIAVGDCQNGQPDLGRFFVTDIRSLTFANGQPDDLLQPARVLASGNVLNMQTAAPLFDGKNANLKFGFEAGSFGLLHPSLSYEQRLGEKLSMSLQGTYIQSDGDYPFTVYYTQSKTDSSSRERRTHSAVRMTNIEGNLFYTIDDHQRLTAKLHYYNAFQQLPGPVIYYRETPGSESSRDQSGFVQFNYLNYRSLDWTFRLDGKIYAVQNIYDDSAYQGSTGLLHCDYRQTEYYFSGGVSHWLKNKSVNLSYSSDYFFNGLESNVESCAKVGRHSWLNALSAKAFLGKVNLTTTMLYSMHSEAILDDFAKEYRHFTPYFGITYQPFDNKELRIRYFVKQNYRLPNFNECYYAYMSRDLSPEKALQNNMGITYSLNPRKVLDKVSFIVDGYYNRVSDKIVAIPRQSLYMWSMMNIGLVEITGVDAKATADFSFPKEIGLSLDATYTFQQALDISDEKSKTYNQQIPYTPRHSASASLYLTSRIVDFGYNLVFVGDRYKLGQNIESNLVERYVDQSVILAKKIELKYGSLKLQAQVLNLFDVQYEVVKNYPMMGRNYKIKLVYEF